MLTLVLKRCEMKTADYLLYFPDGASSKESDCQHRRCKKHEFDPWVGKIPWRREWQPIPLFLPGGAHGQKSPLGYSA